MKPDSIFTTENIDSMSTDNCSLRLKILTLVINTADFINERSTVFLTLSHALVAPIAIFTTFIFIGILVVAALISKPASIFLQIYGIVACASIQTGLSLIIFNNLIDMRKVKTEGGLILNGILPLLILTLLLADLILTLFSSRESISAPPMPVNMGNQNMELQSEISQ